MNPVKFVATPEAGVPSAGLIRVGDVFITNVLPVPVCAATAVALPVLVIGPVRLAFVVTVPAVNPAAVPVRFVATPDDGVPSAGLIRTGFVDSTVLPVPVEAATPVPPLVTGNGVVADNVVNAPAAGVVPPMAVLLIVPPEIVADVLSRILKLSVAFAIKGKRNKTRIILFIFLVPNR